jgi:Golgi apyrase
MDSTTPPLIGTGSFDTCLTRLKPLLAQADDCPAKHCLFAGLPTPQIDFEREDQRGFIGVSEYWYTAHQVLGLGGVWDWGEWEKGMGAFCGRDWKDVEDEVEREKGWKGAQVS